MSARVWAARNFERMGEPCSLAPPRKDDYACSEREFAVVKKNSKKTWNLGGFGSVSFPSLEAKRTASPAGGKVHMARADNSFQPEDPPRPEAPGKRNEMLAFVFLAVVLFPLLSVILVGGFGFVIWMQHLMFGPPVGP